MKSSNIYIYIYWEHISPTDVYPRGWSNNVDSKLTQALTQVLSQPFNQCFNARLAIGFSPCDNTLLIPSLDLTLYTSTQLKQTLLFAYKTKRSSNSIFRSNSNKHWCRWCRWQLSCTCPWTLECCSQKSKLCTTLNVHQVNMAYGPGLVDSQLPDRQTLALRPTDPQARKP